MTLAGRSTCSSGRRPRGSIRSTTSSPSRASFVQTHHTDRRAGQVASDLLCLTRVNEARADLRTADGTLDVYTFTPTDGSGPWPAVILYMDAFGIRPNL